MRPAQHFAGTNEDKISHLHTKLGHFLRKQSNELGWISNS